MTRTIQRRLAVIEGMRLVEEPRRILADRPIDEDEGADALANWQSLVASGEATLVGDVLSLMGPPLTEEQWIANFEAPG